MGLVGAVEKLALKQLNLHLRGKNNTKCKSQLTQLTSDAGSTTLRIPTVAFLCVVDGGVETETSSWRMTMHCVASKVNSIGPWSKVCDMCIGLIKDISSILIGIAVKHDNNQDSGEFLVRC